MSDLTGQIIDYENGDLDDDAIIELFQALIDNGMAWSLQGHYGRAAQMLIERGFCQPSSGIAKQKVEDNA